MATQPQQPELYLGFFHSIEETTDYIIDELVATLRDDIAELSHQQGEADQCAEQQAKIEDIETVAPLLQSAPAILRLLRLAELHDAALNSAERAPDGDDYNTLMGFLNDMRRAINSGADDGSELRVA